MKVIIPCLALLLSSILYAKDVSEIKSNVSSVDMVTVDDNIARISVKNYEENYSSEVINVAKQYFNSIDITRNDWSGLSATKQLYFGKNKEIVQEISIIVPPLYEMLLFSGSGGSYKASKLLDKTIKKQCDRYISRLSDFKDSLNDYMMMANMTTNKIVATLKNSKVVIVSFKCELSI